MDYEEYEALPPGELGYFHASGTARKTPTAGLLWSRGCLIGRRPTSLKSPWVPKAWMVKNTDGKDNYVILDAEGKGQICRL